jgi:hypothetical protein
VPVADNPASPAAWAGDSPAGTTSTVCMARKNIFNDFMGLTVSGRGGLMRQNEAQLNLDLLSQY